MTDGGLTSIRHSPAPVVRGAQSWAEYIPPASRVRIAVIAALFLLLFGEAVYRLLLHRWWHDDDWSHGWLIPLFSLYLLGSRREELFRAQPQPSYAGAWLLAVSIGAFFFSAWWARMAYPQGLSIIAALAGVTLCLGGWRVMRVAWFPIAFLALAVPVPSRLYVELTFPLRRLASTVAAAVMPVFAPGLHTEAQAVVIDYVMPGMPPGTLNVDEACSGMRSTMAFITLGVAMAYLGDRATWQRVILLASCIPIAVLCNAVRVTVSGLLHVHGYPELARGTPHQVLGVVMFAVALGLYGLVSVVLSRLFVEDPDA